MGKLLTPPLAAFLFLALTVVPAARPAAAADSPAYVALGDSIAFGLGVADPAAEGYVWLAHGALRRSDRYQESGLDLLNLGQPGALSADLLRPEGQLDQALAEIDARRATSISDDAVEIISLNIGGNDLLSLANPDSPCLRETAGEACLTAFGQVLSAVQANTLEVATRLREAAPESGIVLLNLYNPYSGTGDLRESIADLAVQQLNGVLGVIAADPDLNVRMGDVFQLFRGRGNQWIAQDRIHPNQNGHRVIAEVLLATIDGRDPVIPEELLSATPAPVANPTIGATPTDADPDAGDDTWLLLLIVIPLAFAAGVVTSGVYFLARGRG